MACISGKSKSTSKPSATQFLNEEIMPSRAEGRVGIAVSFENAATYLVASATLEIKSSDVISRTD